MTSTDPQLLERFRAAVSVLAALPAEADEYSALTESALLQINTMYGEAQLALRGRGALIAGEIAHRSAPALGAQGLAQRSGHRTAEQFIKVTTGSTGREAVTAVRVGGLMREAATEGQLDTYTGEISVPAQPWMAPVTAALHSHLISVDAAEAIRNGLGTPNSAVTVAQLADGAQQLVEAAVQLDPDALAREARALRDELDLDGVKLREEERRAKRSLRLFVQPDGTTKLVWIMDPETAAVVRDLYDRATSPKLGGVRFVDPALQSAAQSILKDTRTPEQLASDDFAQLLKLGADTDPGFLLGSGAPSIILTVTREAFEGAPGLARIEGQLAPVSVDTARRLACESSIAAMGFDEHEQPLDLGRDQRFFNRRQCRVLAVRWGGCAAPGCNRPPSWTEAHHIVPWRRDGGKTDILDGVPLCRHHHLLFHNNGWEIVRDEESRYWLIPPHDQSASRTPVELKPNGPAMRDLRRERRGKVSQGTFGQGKFGEGKFGEGKRDFGRREHPPGRAAG